MRLGILTSWPLTTATGSGVTASIRGFALGLDALGAQVRFVSPVRPARTATGTFLKRLFYNGRIPRLIRRAVRREELDALLGFDFDGCYLEAGSRPPLTVVCGGTLADIVRFEDGWSRRLLRIQARLEGQNLSLADRIVVPSRYAAGAVRHHYSGTGVEPEVVPLAIDVQGWEDERALPPSLSLTRPVVLSVARFYRRKSLDLLLSAWGRVISRLGEGTLVLVGSGPQERPLRRLARSLGIEASVRFAGEELNRGRLKGWYESADLFCLPSRHETFGLVYAEAGLHGLCTLALSTTAVPEVIVNGETGLLLPEREDSLLIGDLAGALLRLLKDDGARMAMGRAARTAARSRTWHDAARDLHSLLG